MRTDASDNHSVMLYEDAAGFISHYHLMGREELDAGFVEVGSKDQEIGKRNGPS